MTSTCSGIKEEIQTLFPTAATVSTPSHKDVLPRADRLLTQLRSKSETVRDKHVRRRRKHTGKSREYQRYLIVIDYPVTTVAAVQVLHDYDKAIFYVFYKRMFYT